MQTSLHTDSRLSTGMPHTLRSMLRFAVFLFFAWTPLTSLVMAGCYSGREEDQYLAELMDWNMPGLKNYYLYPVSFNWACYLILEYFQVKVGWSRGFLRFGHLGFLLEVLCPENQEFIWVEKQQVLLSHWRANQFVEFILLFDQAALTSSFSMIVILIFSWAPN